MEINRTIVTVLDMPGRGTLVNSSSSSVAIANEIPLCFPSLLAILLLFSTSLSKCVISQLVFFSERVADLQLCRVLVALSTISFCLQCVIRFVMVCGFHKTMGSRTCA